MQDTDALDQANLALLVQIIAMFVGTGEHTEIIGRIAELVTEPTHENIEAAMREAKKLVDG